MNITVNIKPRNFTITVTSHQLSKPFMHTFVSASHILRSLVGIYGSKAKEVRTSEDFLTSVRTITNQHRHEMNKTDREQWQKILILIGFYPPVETDKFRYVDLSPYLMNVCNVLGGYKAVNSRYYLASQIQFLLDRHLWHGVRTCSIKQTQEILAGNDYLKANTDDGKIYALDSHDGRISQAIISHVQLKKKKTSTLISLSENMDTKYHRFGHKTLSIAISSEVFNSQYDEPTEFLFVNEGNIPEAPLPESESNFHENRAHNEELDIDNEESETPIPDNENANYSPISHTVLISHARAMQLLESDDRAQEKNDEGETVLERVKSSQEAFIINGVKKKYVVLLPNGYGHCLADLNDGEFEKIFVNLLIYFRNINRFNSCFRRNADVFDAIRSLREAISRAREMVNMRQDPSVLIYEVKRILQKAFRNNRHFYLKFEQYLLNIQNIINLRLINEQNIQPLETGRLTPDEIMPHLSKYALTDEDKEKMRERKMLLVASQLGEVVDVDEYDDQYYLSSDDEDLTSETEAMEDEDNFSDVDDYYDYQKGLSLPSPLPGSPR